MYLVGMCTTLGRIDYVAALSMQQGQQCLSEPIAVDRLDHSDRLVPGLVSLFPSLDHRCRRISQRQSYSDDDYAKGDELNQVVWPFPVRISITEKTRSANPQRVINFHVYSTPFTNEMTIFIW